MTNKIILSLLIGFASIASAQFSTLERIMVTNVSQMGDFMPPVPENARPLTTITFKAWSNGCTSADSFEVGVEILENGTQMVAIERTVADTCRRVAMLEEFQVTSSDLDISSVGFSGNQSVTWNPIVIANPVLVNDLTTH